MFFGYLDLWMQTNMGVSTEWLALNNVPALAMALQEFVYDAFEKSFGLGRIKETLNAVAQYFHWTRGQLSGPWKAITAWKVKSPTTPHWPIPLFLLNALAGLAIAWDWHLVAALLLLGFYGFMRPGELTGLLREHIMLMSENEGERYIPMGIQNPKMTFKRGRRR